MKILLLHQHFNTPATGGALRSYYLAKALVEKNIEVAVITGYNGNEYKQENIDGIEVHYLAVPYHNRFGFWKRILSFLRYNYRTIGLAGKIKNISLCYAMSVPLTIGLAAHWIKVRYGIKFIFEVGDLWPDAPIQMQFVRNYFLKRALYALEKFIYNSASEVVALSPAIQSAVLSKVPQRKVHLIPNMGDTEFYKLSAKDEAVTTDFGVKSKFVVSYIGAIGLANGLDFYVECARASQKAGLPIHFLLCGDGALLDYFKRIISQQRLENFSIVPFQDRDGVRKIMTVTDAVFICYKHIPILETGSPNKYFDGLAAGKLIAINFGGWIKEEIENYSCGIFIDPRQPTDFVKKIRPFVSDMEKVKQYQQAARSLAETKYSRKLLSEKFVDIIRNGASL